MAAKKKTEAEAPESIDTDAAPAVAVQPDSSLKAKKGNDYKSQRAALMGSPAMSALLKNYGKNTFVTGTEMRARTRKRIPTGIFPLDFALEGGWAQGGVHTLAGHKSSFKTTALYGTIGQAQQMCANCWEHQSKCSCKDFREPVIFFLDVEGAVDKSWAARFLDLDKVEFSIPEFAEQALEIFEVLIRAQADIIVLDSIAFLTPAKEIEESMSKDMMGVQARTIGRGIRKFNAALNAGMSENGKRPTVFFTNQIRMKLGVMFGCFHEDTPVMFADGSQQRIRDVVEQRLEGPVLSWDGNHIVERKLVNWFKNGPLQEGEEWLTFRVAGTNGQRGAQGFTCTPNHVLVSGDGQEVRAGTIRPGDTLTSWYEATLSPTETEVLYGSLMGDGHVTPAGNLQLANSEQDEYLRWKRGLFTSRGFTRVESGGKTSWRTPASYELRQVRSLFYGSAETKDAKDYRTIPLDLLKSAGPLMLATWFCDDGFYKETHESASLSVKRLTAEHAHKVAAVLAERFPGVSYSATQQALVFPTETFKSFSAHIARYVPACMAYKLLPEHQALSAPIVSEPSVLRRVTTPVKVLGVKFSKKKARARNKYDLQVEGNSFYLVGGDSAGVVVHNSPETTPGGLAPGFMAWTEVKMKGGKYKMDDDGERALFADFGFSIEKSKTSTPRTAYEFRMMLAETGTQKLGQIDDGDFIVTHLERLGVISGGGTSWSCLGEKFGKKTEIAQRMLTDKAFASKAKDFLIQSVTATR